MNDQINVYFFLRREHHFRPAVAWRLSFAMTHETP